MREIPHSTAAPPGAMHLIASGAIVAIALLRVMCAFTADAVFAADPATDPTPVMAIGPVGSLLLDHLLLAAAALAFVAERRGGRGVSLLPVALPMLSLPFVLVHGWNDQENLSQGATWFAAATAAVAAAHLARDGRLRGLMIAAMIAAIFPLGVRGLAQVFIEHPRDIAFYEANREQILRNMGLEPGSASAAIYERRIGQPEATGWFRLANVYGTFMVFSVIAWAGVLTAVIRSQSKRGAREAASSDSPVLLFGVAAGGLLLAGLGLWFAGSKGAFAAAALGGMLIAAATLLRRSAVPPSRAARLGAALALAAPLLALAAVLVRGAALPESFLNDRSVLFRWHYLVGSSRIIADSPLTGVGPADFQDAYIQHRLPVSPEDVASAHSVAIDWIAGLGIGGAALLILLGVLLLRIGRAISGETRSEGTMHAPAWIAAVTTVAFGGALWVERFTLGDPLTSIARLLGLIGFVASVSLICKLMLKARRATAIIHVTLAAAAIAAVAHGQIELSFTHPGSAVWLLVMLGLVAGVRISGPRAGLNGIAAALLLILVVAGAAVFVLPALRQQRISADIQQSLIGFGERHLEMLEHGAGLDEVRRHEAQLLAARLDAAAALRDAWHVYPANTTVLDASYQQFMFAAVSAAATPAERIAAADSAIAVAEALLQEEEAPGALALSAAAHTYRASLRGGDYGLAIAHRRRLVELDPFGVQTRLALADLLWEAGRREAAAEQYQETLKLSENWRLDPLRQLTDAERGRVESRLED